MGAKKKRTFEPLVEDVANASSALGHPLRIEIYRFILEHNAKLKRVRNKDIVAHFDFAQSTISGHLNKLVSGGMVREKREKTSTLYYANVGFVSEYVKNLNSLAKLLNR
jgi:DNA-binding transcriptional ArsR family regulator